MRILALLLACAFIIGAGQLLPGTKGQADDHRVSVQIAGPSAGPTLSGGREKTP